MGDEKLIPWVPVEGVPHTLYVEAVHDDYEGLRILLRPKTATGPTLRLLFESVVGYRNINESYRLRSWSKIGDIGALPTLLVVQQSKWAAWLVDESGGLLSTDRLVHYAIYSPEDCIDLVTEFPPEVSWLNA